MADQRTAPDTQDDPADAVTVHPGTSTAIPTRSDKRGLLHMLHDEIADRLGLTGPKSLPSGVDPTTGKQTGLMDAVNAAVGQAQNANPDNP